MHKDLRIWCQSKKKWNSFVAYLHEVSNSSGILTKKKFLGNKRSLLHKRILIFCMTHIMHIVSYFGTKNLGWILHFIISYSIFINYLNWIAEWTFCNNFHFKYNYSLDFLVQIVVLILLSYRLTQITSWLISTKTLAGIKIGQVSISARAEIKPIRIFHSSFAEI
jgi:hypothetical protein